MDSLPPPLAFVVLLVAGWVNRQQQAVIDYLHEENRVVITEKPTFRASAPTDRDLVGERGLWRPEIHAIGQSQAEAGRSRGRSVDSNDVDTRRGSGDYAAVRS